MEEDNFDKKLDDIVNQFNSIVDAVNNGDVEKKEVDNEKEIDIKKLKGAIAASKKMLEATARAPRMERRNKSRKTTEGKKGGRRNKSRKTTEGKKGGRRNNFARNGFNAPRKIDDRYVRFMNLQNLKDGNVVSIAFATRFFTAYFKLACAPHTDGPQYILLTDPLKELFQPEVDRYYQEKVVKPGFDKPHTHRTGDYRYDEEIGDYRYETRQCDGSKHLPIDMDHFKYIDLQKVLTFVIQKREKVTTSNKEINVFSSGTSTYFPIIPYPDHLDPLSDLLKEVTLIFREHQMRVRNLDKRQKIESMDDETYQDEFLRLEARHKEEVTNVRLKWTVMGLTPLKMVVVENEDGKKEMFKVYGGDDDSECCICLEEDKTHVFKPCGHYVCCGGCVELLQNAKQPCPICRKYFVEVVLYTRCKG